MTEAPSPTVVPWPDEPAISIVMPAYNAKTFLESAIGSIQEQEFRNWELIVVDDASSDGTHELLMRLAGEDQRLVVERFDRNQGAAAARNRALELARGRYLAFLDSDDRWLPRKLARQLAFMQGNDAAFSCTDYEIISESGETIAQAPRVPERMSYENLLSNTLVGCSTVMLDRQLLGTPRFPPMKTRQDWALWLSLLKPGREALGLNEVLTQYRLSPKGISKNKLKAARQVWRVYRDQEQLGLFRAARHFLRYAWKTTRKHASYR